MMTPEPPAPCALITGFGPFPRVARNPSQLLVERLRHLWPESLAGLRLERRVLPTDYAASGALIAEWLSALRPALWLGIGVGRGTAPVLRLETTARNWCSDRPDVAGIARPGALMAEGPATYSAILPLAAVHAALEGNGHRAVLSDDAGAYVCNAVFYGACHTVAAARLPTLCGFLHIPEHDPARAEADELAALADAVRIIVETTADFLEGV